MTKYTKENARRRFFSAGEVRAILAGSLRKFRVPISRPNRCSLYPVGSYLWVPERWRPLHFTEHGDIQVHYKIDGATKWEMLDDRFDPDGEKFNDWWAATSDVYRKSGLFDDEGNYIVPPCDVIKWRSPVAMPRCLSRITLEIMYYRLTYFRTKNGNEWFHCYYFRVVQ